MASIPNGGATPPGRRISPAAAGFLSLAAFASLLVPLVGAFLALLSPLPLIHLVSSGKPSLLGWGWVAVLLVGAALLWQTTWAITAAVGYLLVAVWPAQATELWLRRSWSTGRWLAVVAAVALGVGSVALIAAFAPTPAAEALAAMVTEAVAEAGTLVRGLAGSGDNEELMRWAAQVTAYLAPALLAMYVISGALWLRPRLPLLGLPRGQEPFSSYSSEEWLPVAFAVGGLGWVFANGTAKWFCANLFATVLVLYMLHGLAVVYFYLGRRLETNRWVRLLVAFMVLQIPVALGLSAVGLADSFFRLRRGEQFDEGSGQ